MRLFKTSIVVALAFSMAACNEDSGSDSSAICQNIGTDGAVVSRSGGVQFDATEQAFDGDLSTAAEMYTLTGTGTAVLRISGQTSEAAFAGILLGLPAGQVTQVDIRASRNGELVSSGNAGMRSETSQTCPGLCVQQGDQSFFGIAVNGSFDEIQATVQVSGTTDDTLIFELCSRN